MRSIAAALCVALIFLAAPVWAGDNPHARILLEFDNDSNYVEPSPYTMVTATVYVEDLGPGSGIRGVTFKIEPSGSLDFFGFTPANSGLYLGDDEEGWVVSWPDCQTPDGEGRVAVADVAYLYWYDPASLQIVPHDVEGRVLVDCNFESDTWCVRKNPSGHGGVWAAPPPGECFRTWTVSATGQGDVTTIQAGIDTASAGDTVEVMSGVYHEHDITLASGVVVRSEAGDPDSVTVDADSLGRVFYTSGASSSTILDGFTITGGYATGSGFDEQGGGMLCLSPMQIRNCVFTGNAADGEGGGIKVWYDHPVIRNCTFVDNYSGGPGGGVNLQGDSATVTGCLISGNRADEGGGGLCITSGAALIESCTVTDNTVLGSSVESGGGIYVGINGTPHFYDCEISGNLAGYGGAIYAFSATGGSVDLVGCTIEGNYAATTTGGMYNGTASATITNCTFAYNEGGNGSGVRFYNSTVWVSSSIVAFNTGSAGLVCGGTSTIDVACSDIFGNSGGDWVGCIAAYDSIQGNFCADPLFCQTGMGQGDTLTLQGLSPCATDTCAFLTEYGVIGSKPIGCGNPVTWVGMGDGFSWSDTANWSPDRVPTSEDHAYIPANAWWNILVAGSTTVFALTIDSSYSYSPSLDIDSDTLTVIFGGSNSGEIIIDAGAAFEISAGGTYVNEFGGTIMLDGGDIIGDGVLENYGLLLKETPMKARSLCSVRCDIFNQNDDPGDGAIVVNDGTLAVEGELANAGSVTVSPEASMRLDPGDGAKSRSDGFGNESGGVWIVEEGASLEILGDSTVFTNQLGGEVILNGGHVTGTGRFDNYGLLRKTDPAKGTRALSHVEVKFNNLSDDPGDGAIVVEEGVLSFEAEVANEGSLTVYSGGSATVNPGAKASRSTPVFVNSNYVEIQWGGSMSLIGAEAVFDNQAGSTLILEGGGDLLGDGLIENRGLIHKLDPMKGSRAVTRVKCNVNNMSDDPGDGAITIDDGLVSVQGELQNDGSITVDSAAALAVEDTSAGGVKDGERAITGRMTNTGTVTVNRGGEFQAVGNVTNNLLGSFDFGGNVSIESSSVFENFGVVRIDSGSFVYNEGTFDHKENAVLTGRGTFNEGGGAFIAAGILRPGDSAGRLTFIGDLTLSPTSELELEIGGTAPEAEHDQLAVFGDATFDGAAYITLTGGFEPLEGDSFAVVTVTGVKEGRGAFDCFSGLETAGGLYLDPVEEIDVFALVAKDSITGNGRPVTEPDFDSTDAATAIQIRVLLNDTDPDLDGLRITALSTGSTTGNVTIGAGDTVVTFTPLRTQHGHDSFDYVVTDCMGGTDTATVTVGVARLPRTWRVPEHAGSIGAGLDSAWAKDTVVVTAGYYPEHDLAMESGVLLISEGGAAETVIDADSAGKVFLIENADSTTLIQGFTLTGGLWLADGGAVFVEQSYLRFVDCVFTGNSAFDGGGIYFYRSSPILTNCVIWGNHADDDGGGVHCNNSSPVFVNCTISGNSAPDGGGVYSWNSSAPSFENSIIAFSTQGEAVRCLPLSSATLVCSDVYGNAGGDWVDCIAGQSGINNNFSADPFFCYPDTGNFYLDAASPCADNVPCGLVGALPAGCDVVTDVAGGEDAPAPSEFRLHTNRPNPFNPTTTIRFDLPRRARVVLSVYAISGRRVTVLADGHYGPGVFERTWDGRDDRGREVASGVYFTRLVAGDFTATKKMVLLR